MKPELSADDVRANPNPGPGISHDFYCTHDPCVCLDGPPDDVPSLGLKPARDAEYVAEPKVEILGFTGTREGMTEDQKGTVMAILDDHAVVEVHHGDCLGADNDFDALARRQRVPRVIHPPSDPKLRAYCTSEIELMPEKPYLDRNRDIVDACTTLLATPKEYAEQYKGGTWYTVHYARKQGKRTIIVWPDGSTLIDGDVSAQ